MRSTTDLKQIDGAQWQRISYEVKKSITYGYWSYS